MVNKLETSISVTRTCSRNDAHFYQMQQLNIETMLDPNTKSTIAAMGDPAQRNLHG